MLQGWKVSVLAAATSIALTSFAAAEVVYNRGNAGDPETVDPHKTQTVQEANINRDLSEGLLAQDAEAKLIPGAAESWTISPDGKVYTFKLRADGKWSNGDPVVAGDFVFSMRRELDPATGAQYANLLFPIKNAEKVNKGEAPADTLGVKAVDDRTLEITLEAPTPYFLSILPHQSTYPVHPASVKKFGNDYVKPGNFVTNGPFVLTEFTPHEKLVMVKNPHFHDAANVKIDKVIYYPTEDRGAGLRRYMAGEIDSLDDIPTEQFKLIHEKLETQFHQAPYLGTYYYVFNTRKKPFDDVRVRTALSMAIDRDFVADNIWGGAQLPAYSFVPPGIPGYTPADVDFKDMSPIDREDKAKALLKEAGFEPGKNPLKVTISFNSGENHKNTAVAIADMWKNIGVEAGLANADMKTHYAMLRNKGDFDVARAAWIGDYADPQNFLFLNESSNKGLNYATYSNAAYDALMAKAANEIDLAKRAQYLHDAEAISAKDQPNIAITTYRSTNLVAPKIEGWKANVLDVHPSRFLSIKQ